jgi:peptidoglycan pentaglycine glycine transferase (the first glycine)
MKYMTTLRQCQDKQQWDDYVLEYGGHPLQLWGWGDLKAVHGWVASRLFLTDEDGEVLGAAQVLIRKLPTPFRSLSYIPRGPVVDEANREDLLNLLADYVDRMYHSVALTIEPDCIEYSVPEGWTKSKNHILPARTIILDLVKTEAELLNDMVKKTRQYIRKSAAEAITIKMVRSREDLDKCLAIYHETAKRAKFKLHSDQYYNDVFSKLNDHSPVFAAYVDDQPIAFLWLAISADTAFELYGGVNELGQQLRANYALKWHAILKCKEWGLGRYDFGGLIEGGVSTFKLGWATDETELAGTFDRPLSIFYGIWSHSLPFGKTIIRRIKGLFKR